MKVYEIEGFGFFSGDLKTIKQFVSESGGGMPGRLKVKEHEVREVGIGDLEELAEANRLAKEADKRVDDLKAKYTNKPVRLPRDGRTALGLCLGRVSRDGPQMRLRR